MGKSALWAIAALVIVGALLYAAGFRIVGPGGQPLLSGQESGGGKQQPGWRRSQQQAGQEQMGSAGSGQGQGRRAQMNQNGGGGGNGRGVQARGQQPGFGPTGGILLPIKMGSAATPVSVGGKETASFVGKDLTDHVEDTVIATADGPRKGWSVAKTLKYLGVENYREAAFVGADGKKAVVSLQQINDQQTIPLFTYNESGQLMVVSGPKVRGASKGNITLEQVKQTVAGRTDLLNVSNIQKVEVKS